MRNILVSFGFLHLMICTFILFHSRQKKKKKERLKLAFLFLVRTLDDSKQNKKKGVSNATLQNVHSSPLELELKDIGSVLHQLQQTQSTARQVRIVQKPQHNLQEDLQDEGVETFS